VDRGSRAPQRQFNIGCHETETVEGGDVGEFDVANGGAQRPVPMPRALFALLCN
jgi:hypothetical protein